MEFALNNAPELTMLEITKKLFNNPFLSNVVFNFENNIIYAHSLELMKRSIIFQKQFESMPKPTSETASNTSLITIDNFSYKSFYEFIRFIYTDDCNINIDNSVELFKLAIKYKIVKLENQILDFLLQRGVPLRVRLSVYAYCVTEHYELPYNILKYDIARNLSGVMDLSMFPLIEPSVIEDILKLDCVDECIKEIQIFNGLIRWMNKHCDTNKIDLTQRREKFGKLLQLIRYAHMTMEEFRQSVLNNCDLFADSDICVMFKDPTPIPKPRKTCEKKFDRRNILNNNTRSETKFKVSEEVIFAGFRYGAGGNHEIKIFGKDLATNNTDVIKLNKKFKDDTIYKTISLGESLVLKPNTEYLIQIVYDNGGFTCWCVTYRMTTILIHDPLNAVEILQPGVTVFEMFFKPPIVEIIEPTMDTPPDTAAESSKTEITQSELISPTENNKKEPDTPLEGWTEISGSSSFYVSQQPASKAGALIPSQAAKSSETSQNKLLSKPPQKKTNSDPNQEEESDSEPSQANNLPQSLQDRIAAKLKEARSCLAHNSSSKKTLPVENSSNPSQDESSYQPGQLDTSSEPPPTTSDVAQITTVSVSMKPPNPQ